MFFGRTHELDLLRRFYEDDHAKVACIYGRRGMGKTSLLQTFLKDKSHLFFTAYPTTASRQTALFAAVQGMDESLLPDHKQSEKRLEKVLHNIEESVTSTFVLVIDHYPFFSKSDTSFDKILFTFVTENWKQMPIKLILCGDSYLQMQKIVFANKSVWKNQLDLTIEMDGLSFYETKRYLGSREDLDLAVLYGITGGIPYQLNRVADSIEGSVENIYFSGESGSLLPEETIQSELRELSYYNHILETLAHGHNRVNKISECVNKPKDVVVPYMNTLMSIGVVTKENPVTEKTNRKKTRYSIINSFDRFWYQLISPRMDMYYANQVRGLIDEHIMPNLPTFMENVFISMCREYLEEMSKRSELPFQIREIGNWWQNDEDKQISEGFDLVALGETDGEDAMAFARCYYTEQPIGIAILKELIDLTKQVKGKRNVFYLIFSKSGFHENTTTVASTIKNIILVSLSDICSVEV